MRPKRLRESMRRKRPEKWKGGDWFLHHGNAPARMALSGRQFFLAKNKILTILSDLSPFFFLFSRIKQQLKGKR